MGKRLKISNIENLFWVELGPANNSQRQAIVCSKANPDTKIQTFFVTRIAFINVYQ